jgi:hypothetical protein
MALLSLLYLGVSADPELVVVDWDDVKKRPSVVVVVIAVTLV